METVHKASPEKADKKPVDRSAENPAISIEKSIELVNNVSKNFSPSQWVTRDDIEAVLNTKGLHRQIAACVQYGILLRDKNKYQISPVHKDLLNPLSNDEVRKIRLQFFKSPKLYAELIEKYNGHVIPTDLKIHLVRFHKIATNASADVAELFFENARFVGAISENNILNITETAITPPKKKTPEDGVPDTGAGDESDIELQRLKLIEEEKEKERLKLLSEVNNPITYKIPLSEKKNALLTYPHELNEKDIQILRKYIEVLELGIN